MKKNWTKFLVVALSVMMVFAMTACGGGSGDSSEGGDNVLHLGGAGPLTGPAALYGNAVDNGAKIAVEEINAEDSAFQIEYKAQDDEHDAEKSVNAYNQLKDWGVQVIVGTVTTTPCIAVSAEANNDRIFMLTPSASAADVTANKDQTYQLCFSDPNQGSASAQYISENGLATKVAIIYKNDDAYSTGIYQTFKTKAAELGLEVVSETTFMDGSDNDFTVQLTDAKDKGADLVFLPMYYTPASLILSQADAMGYAPTFFGVDGMDGILGIEGFDTKLAEDVILLTPFAADATDDLTVNFVKQYNDKFGETPNQFAADAYDAVYIIKAAIEKSGVTPDMSVSDIGTKLTEAMTQIEASGLTSAKMTWSANGEPNKEPKAVVIKGGVYVSAE